MGETPRPRLDPVGIGPFQPVAKLDSIRRDQAQPGVPEFDLMFTGGNFQHRGRQTGQGRTGFPGLDRAFGSAHDRNSGALLKRRIIDENAGIRGVYRNQRWFVNVIEAYFYPVLGLCIRQAPLMQKRLPVEDYEPVESVVFAGSSSKTWPRCEPYLAQTNLITSRRSR